MQAYSRNLYEDLGDMCAQGGKYPLDSDIDACREFFKHNIYRTAKALFQANEKLHLETTLDYILGLIKEFCKQNDFRLKESENDSTSSIEEEAILNLLKSSFIPMSEWNIYDLGFHHLKKNRFAVPEKLKEGKKEQAFNYASSIVF